jgi:hypothetical protein
MITDYRSNKDKSENECAICSQDKRDGDLVVRLPCLHTYHSDCAVPWLKMKTLCPTCKYDVKAK